MFRLIWFIKKKAAGDLIVHYKLLSRISECKNKGECEGRRYLYFQGLYGTQIP